MVSADGEGSSEDVPDRPVAVLDYRWASPWAGITDLHGGGPYGIGFTMWESFDVACEVERSDDGRVRGGAAPCGQDALGDGHAVEVVG